MVLKNLVVYGIFNDGTFSYRFDSLKKTGRKKDVDNIRAAIDYAFFGDITLAHGRVEMTFDQDGEKTLVRDFEQNIAFIQSADGMMEGEDAVNAYISSLVCLGKERFDTFLETNEKEIYEKSFEKTDDYFRSVLSSLSIRKEDIDNASDRYKAILEDYKKRDVVLSEVAEGFKEDEIGAKIKSLTEQVEDLRGKVSKEKQFLFLNEQKQQLANEYEETGKKYVELLSQKGDIDKLRARVDRSDRIKRLVTALRKSSSLITESDKLKVAIDDKKKTLDEKIKESEAGERVLRAKQSAFSQLSATISGSYTALSELICNNASGGKSDKAILDNVERHFSKLEKAVSSLEEKEQALLDELKKTDRDITVYSKKYGDMFVVQALDKLFSFNRDQMSSTEKPESISENTAEAGEKRRALEKKKESLTRTYILSDSLLKEIESIDAKIGENNAAVNSQQENLDALENAKETLSKYVEKCRKKVEEADVEILALGTRKQYFNEINRLEYGAHCPVCNMPVIDKADTTSATAQVDAQLKKCNDDVASYRSVLSEYSDKLNAINLRIGSLRAKIDTGKGYVESLQQSKLLKTALLQKLFEDAGVKSRTQLAELLEKTTLESADAEKAVSDLSSRATVTFIAEENIKKITSYIRELAGEDVGEPIAQGRRNLVALEKQQSLVEGSVSGEGAISGDVYASLQNALVKKQRLLDELSAIREEIASCRSRYATVSDGEKDVSYGQLCIAYAGKQYTSVIEGIRVKEEEKKKLINEIAALTGVLKDKRITIEKDMDEIRDLENRFRYNIELLETIQGDEGYDESLLENTTVAKLESEILPEGEASSITARITEYDKTVATFETRCAALETIASEVADKETFAMHKNDLAALEEELAEKESALEETFGLLSIGKTITKKRTDLLAEAELYRENYSFVNRVYEDGAVIIQDTVNYALNFLAPTYRVECHKGGLVLKKGSRSLSSVSDDMYSILLVSLCDAFRYVVSGILNCPTLPRLLTLKSSTLDDYQKEAVQKYATERNIIIIFVK